MGAQEKKTKIKRGVCGLPWAACGFPPVSSEERWRFPPDAMQLMRVGELCSPKSLAAESQ